MLNSKSGWYTKIYLHVLFIVYGCLEVSKYNQRMNQSYKRAIIAKPVIKSSDDLDEEDRYLTFITKCYGNWQRDEEGGYYFSYDNSLVSG